MDRHTRDIIYTIALGVRQWAENKADEWNQDLTGWCAIASARLHTEMVKAGFIGELHMSSNRCGAHVFVVFEDHVIDVTATQFDFTNEPIFIRHHREAEGISKWFITAETYRDAKTLRKAQVKDGWPQEQIVYR